MNQLELTLPRDGCDDLVEQVAAFTSLLLQYDDWIHANEVLALLGMPATEENRRQVRLWAANTDGWVISGSKGYRHVRKASSEELAAFQAVWLSQIRTMAKRLSQTRRNAHAVIG